MNSVEFPPFPNTVTTEPAENIHRRWKQFNRRILPVPAVEILRYSGSRKTKESLNIRQENEGNTNVSEEKSQEKQRILRETTGSQHVSGNQKLTIDFL